MEMTPKSKQFNIVATDEEDFRHDANIVPVGASRKLMVMMVAVVSFLMALTSFATMYGTKAFAATDAMSGRARGHWIPTLLTDIAVYPGYAGGLLPRGRVTVRFEDDENELLMRYELEGLETNCKGCGIHIHEGESCEEAAGHYFNHSLYESSDDDPWLEAMYNSNEEGDASNALVVPTGGMGSKVTKNHAVVIHSQDGTRIGCGVLNNIFNINSMEANVGVYPGYDNVANKRIAPTGTARIMAFEDNVLRLRGTLDGLEPNCIKCGLHIHAGLLSCNTTETIGDHWYEEEEMAGDPWVAQKATYTSDAKGHTKFAFYVYNGFDYENNIDHVLVIHGSDGTRIGCGVIKPREIF